MPMGCMIAWVIETTDREEVKATEEMKAKQKKEEKKKEKGNERKSRKERKGMRNCADAKRTENSPITLKRSNTTTRNVQPSKNNTMTSNAIYTTRSTSRRR